MADELENEEDFEMDFRRLKESHVKAGYVEGLQAGEESSLQQGFNEGFAKTVAVTSEFSKLLGSMSAVLSFLKLSHAKRKPDCAGVIREILKLKEEVKALEQKALSECEKILTEQDNPELNQVTDRNKKTCGQSDSCSGKESGPQTVSSDINICSGVKCRKNNDGTLTEAEKKGLEVSEDTVSNDSSPFHSELERIGKRFRSMVEKELNIVLHL